MECLSSNPLKELNGRGIRKQEDVCTLPLATPFPPAVLGSKLLGTDSVSFAQVPVAGAVFGHAFVRDVALDTPRRESLRAEARKPCAETRDQGSSRSIDL